MNERLSLPDLVDLLVQKYAVGRKEAETFIKTLFDLIEEVLEKEQSVKVKGLGSFKLVQVDDRESININTGERFEIQGYAKVSFSPEPALRDLINKPFAHFETVVLNDSTTFDDLPEPDESVAPAVGADDEEVEEEPLTESFIHAPEHKTNRIHKVLATSGALLKEELAPAKETPAEAAAESPAEEISAEVAEESPAEEIPAVVEESTIKSPVGTPDEVAVELPAEETVEEPVSLSENNQEPEVLPDTSPEPETSLEVAEPNSEEPSAEAEAESTEVVSAESNEENSEMPLESQPIEDEKPLENCPTEEEKSLQSRPTDEEKPLTAGPVIPEKKKSHRIVLWLLLVLVVAAAIGYFIYQDIHKQPLRMPGEEVEKITPAQLLADSLRRDSLRQDSLQRDSLWLATHPNDSISLDTLLTHETPAATAPAPQATHAVAPATTAASATTAAPVAGTASKTPTATTSAPTAPAATTVAKPAATTATVAPEAYSLQTKYEAVGTMTTHAIEPGETLRKIALKYYGHKEFSNYIVNYNASVIKDPNQVPVGTVLNIPKLKAK